MSAFPIVADPAATNDARVGERTRRMWMQLMAASDLYERLVEEICLSLPTWPSIRGAALLAGFDYERDSKMLAEEGVKALVMYAAAGAMLPLPSPVMEAMLFGLRQVSLVQELYTMRIRPVYSEKVAQDLAPYEHGGLTDKIYAEAFGALPLTFFWPEQAKLDKHEALILRVLKSVGIWLRHFIKWDAYDSVDDHTDD